MTVRDRVFSAFKESFDLDDETNTSKLVYQDLDLRLGPRVSPAANDARRIAARDRSRRKRPRHEGVRGDDGAFADLHPGSHYDPRAEPHVGTDDHVALVHGLVHDRRSRLEPVIRGGDEDLGTQQSVMSERDPADRMAGPERATGPDVGIGSYRDPLGVHHGNVRRHPHTGSNIGQSSRSDMAIVIVMDQTQQVDPGTRIDDGPAERQRSIAPLRDAGWFDSSPAIASPRSPAFSPMSPSAGLAQIARLRNPARSNDPRRLCPPAESNWRRAEDQFDPQPGQK
jgi:hypothetical protein